MAAARRRIDVVPATRELAEAIAARMRPADAAEVRASHGHSPLEACLFAMASGVARVALFDGEPACMFGVEVLRRSVISEFGTIWLLTTDLVERFPVTFMRGVRAEIAVLVRPGARLVNAIDVRHVQAIRWAERLGFRLGPPEPEGPEGRLFRWFTVRREDLHV